MLWLTALTFSLVKEVRAADPNVTFLDDGNITYKDLEHGAFELVTKEVIPRYFLVEDPGQTVVLRSQGSSVSVSQSTNSPARMAELQAAQQEALATYEKGLGSTGSSTPPALESLPVQPINFIQTDGSAPGAGIACAAPVDLRLDPGDHFRKTAASAASAANAECGVGADRNRHRRSLTSSRRQAALSLPAVPTAAPR